MRCKLCGRKITAKESKKRGYGPVCWDKIQEKNNEKRIEHLERELKLLKRQIASMSLGNTPTIETPSMNTPLPLGGVDYSISELKESPLFLKMQQLAEA